MQGEMVRLGFEQSRRLLESSRKVIPGGVNSNIRMGEQPHPIFFESAEGPYLFDADGNRLIDYVMGQGPMLLGHRPGFVLEAVEHQLSQGILYGGQHELEVEVARLVTRMVPSAEMVRFNMTGTEAVQAALRIARAATRRHMVVKFEGHYHGWADSVLFNVGSGSHPIAAGPGLATMPESAGMAPEAGSSLIVVPWNDAGALEEVLASVGDSVAAVIMEPVMANSGVVEPAPGYLEAVRDLCDRHGIVLIFDEVITGFRAGLGGAQGRYGVIPDLTTMGKALASGFPVGCVAGRREIMEIVSTGDVTHAGTFNASPISMAAARAALDHLYLGGSELYDTLEARGRRLMEGLGGVIEDHGAPCLVQGLPTVFNLMFTELSAVTNHREVLMTDRARRAAFQSHLAAAGVRISGL
ncbi:MAG: aminotransferase class III-fold pyridoxal phosphate-dependent enzyme, partial [Acidimicrobiia bacterium]|nr:aminotransferase class III-fold pyridoxal phosphate-dependent enzyme [Acidimicrobiia bacterium]